MNNHKLTRIARELLAIDEDIGTRQGRDFTPGYLKHSNFELYMFEQTWPSTALGFPGCGGQALTSAMTYVLVPYDSFELCQVYFGGRHAYAADLNDAFREDMKNQRMVSVMEAHKYNNAQNL